MAYIKTIGLENFRLFKDKTSFDLAPITILTGINSSGKSSLIKSFQLFKSSLEQTGSLDQISFLKGNHNLGNFSKAVHEDSEKKEMKFTFDFPVWGFTEKTLLELTYTASNKEAEDGHLSFLRIYLDQGEDILIYNSKGWKKGDETTHKAFYFNLPFLIPYCLQKLKEEEWEEPNIKYEETDLPRWIKPKNDDLFKSSLSGFFDFEDNWKYMKWDFEEEIFMDYNSIIPEEKSKIKKEMEDAWNNGIDATIISLHDFSILDGIEFGISEIITEIGNKKPKFLLGGDEFENKPTYNFSTLGEIVFNKILIKSILNGISDFESSLKKIEHLSSIRANSDRLYSNHSDIFGINELLREFSKIRLKKGSPIFDFIIESLQKFNLGEEIVIKRTQGIASEVFVKRNGKEYLLADLGFGYTQLLPIILKIAIIAHQAHFYPGAEERPSTVFLLEEPESNLHPSYQSKLAELIVESASLFNIQFIVETHSEYLIRNLQYLTATKKIKPRDTKIYYFHQPGSEDFKESPYRVIEIKEDGRLTNEFGEGFFDEIPRLLAFLYNTNFN
jgi:predicted ATPase